MAGFTKGLLDALNKGAAAVSDAAGNMAESAKARADEMTSNARKGELIRLLGEKVFELYCQGSVMPEALQPMLNELAGIRREEEARMQAKAEKQAEKKEEKKQEGPRAFGWGVQPRTPVPSLSLRDIPSQPERAEAKAAPVMPAAPAVAEAPAAPVFMEEPEEPVDEPAAAIPVVPQPPVPSIQVEEVYTAEE